MLANDEIRDTSDELGTTLHEIRFTDFAHAAWEKARLGAPGSGG
jgi:hypothetical protein